jgi:hypothetical protein
MMNVAMKEFDTARLTINMFVVLFLRSLLLQITVQMDTFNTREAITKTIKHVASKISTDCNCVE